MRKCILTMELTYYEELHSKITVKYKFENAARRKDEIKTILEMKLNVEWFLRLHPGARGNL